MKINFKLNIDEFIRVYLKYLVKTKEFKKKLRFHYIFLLCITLIIFLNSNTLSIMTVILFLVSMIFTKPIMLLLAKKILYKKYRENKYSFLFDDVTITNTEDEIIIIRNYGQKSYKWNYIKEMYLIDEYLFLRFIKEEYIFIPLSTFINSEEEAIFVYFIQSKIKVGINTII